MIRHIVFFSAKQGEDVETIRDGLKELCTIPHSTLFEVTLNSKVDPMGNQIDVVVYAEFADEAALAAYKAHSNYQLSIDLVRPIREMRMAADYETDLAVKQPLG